MTKKAARNGWTATHRWNARRLRHVILLVTPLCIAGCWLVQPITPPCPQVLASPVLVSVYLSEAAPSDRTFALRLREGGGLELELVPWEVRCAKLSEGQVEVWRDNVDILIEGLLEPDERTPGESVQVGYGGQFHGEGIAGVADLSPASLAALRTLSCIAFDEFGRNATRAFRGATPELTRLIDYPEACRSTERAGGPSTANHSGRDPR
jgi:hypothetical protein